MADATTTRTFATAPLDQTARATTFFVAGLVLILPAVVGLASGAPGTAIGAAVVGILILVLSWALSPASYTIDGRELVVRRRLWRAFITTVEGFSRHDDPGLMGWRVVGAGGVFGWFGRFRRADLGVYRAYVTSRDEEVLVALKTAAGPVLVSPQDRRSFVSALKKALR